MVFSKLFITRGDTCYNVKCWRGFQETGVLTLPEGMPEPSFLESNAKS